MKLRVCTDPECGVLVRGGGRCPAHRRTARRIADAKRPSAAERGYGSAWRKRRDEFLELCPTCMDCGAPATVADHDPISRAELVRQGDPDPDALHHLRPRCARCHNRRTARDDGGFGHPKGAGR